MDRILFFCVAKGKREFDTYGIQVFREIIGEFAVYFFQLCGRPKAEELIHVQGEMYKAFERMCNPHQKREEPCHTYLVYDGTFEKYMYDMRYFEQWKRFWKYPLYHEYGKQQNVKSLLERAFQQRQYRKVYILGTGWEMREWLPYLAGKVREIEFYLEMLTKGTEEIQEMLLEEYGMVTRVEMIGNMICEKVRLYSEEPVVVLDFAESISPSFRGLEKGSIWLDMTAMEKKRDLLENRQKSVEYMSLKTIWKREMQQPLDIISKFAYNTDVKIGKL